MYEEVSCNVDARKHERKVVSESREFYAMLFYAWTSMMLQMLWWQIESLTCFCEWCKILVCDRVRGILLIDILLAQSLHSTKHDSLLVMNTEQSH